ncbi:MAG: hypothetical protein ACJ74Q_15100 [Pyrinomonadaceae bacterium]
MKFDKQSLKLRALSLLKHLPPFILRHLSVATLVNSENVKSSIKRMFRNSPAEILGELFQNSSRAGARRVVIVTREGGFTVSDDGSGVAGVTGFQALLKIAETKYQDPAVAQEGPMGIGLMSLLSHDAVRAVTFASGNLELTVETARWFGDDSSYSRTWFDRLRTRAHSVPGLTISVDCAPEMVAALREALKPRDKGGEFSPAQGYAGRLDITLDGAAVETRLPLWAQITQVLVETSYEGARLIIGFRGETTYCERTSSINWYGQLIPVKFDGAFDFHLEVTAGRPVEPRSPSRDGVVNNEAFRRLVAFVTDQLFVFLYDPLNRGRISPFWIAASFSLDNKRALRESPYYVVKTLLPFSTHPQSDTDMDPVGDDVLFAYADDPQPLLLDGGVTVHLEETVEDENGLCTFLGMTGTAYRLSCGNPRRLDIRRVWWKPGAPIKEVFYEPGVWGLGHPGHEPAEWSPVTADNVFTFSQAANWELWDAEMTAHATDQFSFLRTYAWGAFDYDHDEASYNELHDSFESSIDWMIRRIIGRCLGTTFNVNEIVPFFERPDSRVETVTFIYGEQPTPAAINATSQHGETVELKLVA